MAPTPKSHTISTPTSSSKSNQTHLHPHSKTPQSKHRLNFHLTKPSLTPKETPPADHPVEVIGRIRNYPDRKEKPVSALQINSDRHSLRVKTEIGYRDFSLDGISNSEEEDLDGFYKNFVESRINAVKLGDKCTIMMYGPTGSGKSHTMFGCAKQQGIVYKSLKDILGRGDEQNDENGEKVGVGTFVQVTVLEIYNEEIYDLLSTNGGGGISLAWSKGNASKVRLEVMGKKAKNATFISGNEAGKISKEIQKVEKRRIVKSTLCNERSSRSHCMIILDVPTVGGRLMLVDMAGSENIEQAGQSGLEARMQTAKINQGNIALKRVVESIANGDSHVPFRDSKLTMLLQDSFEDDKSKILMILCASPDPKEMHKTISTLEYGAKAKCIVRGPHTPIKDNGAEYSSSTSILGTRIEAMDQFIHKLQMENKLREKECNEAHKELMKKEEEISALRTKLAAAGEKRSGTNEEVINLKVNEWTWILKTELENKIQECQKMTDAFVELEKRKMEERILQQQQELELLKLHLEEIESELRKSKVKNRSIDLDGSRFAKRLLEIYADEDPGVEKSMDLDMSLEFDIGKRDLVVNKTQNDGIQAVLGYSHVSKSSDEDEQDSAASKLANKSILSTVYEAEEEEENDAVKLGDEEVQKEVIEEKTVCSSRSRDRYIFDHGSSSLAFAPSQGSILTPPLASHGIGKVDYFRQKTTEEEYGGSGVASQCQQGNDSSSSQQVRIQNIFTLCGNYREFSQHNSTPISVNKACEDIDPHTSPLRTIGEAPAVNLSPLDLVASNKPGNVHDLTKMLSDENVLKLKENFNNGSTGDLEVYVKWEASKENSGKLITTMKIIRDATLADLRKLIEIYLGADNQAFSFLVLGDPTGAPVRKDDEVAMQAAKLPICNNQLCGRLACLRPAKREVQGPNHLPFSSLENELPLTPRPPPSRKADSLLQQHLNSSPFITL